MSFPMNRIVAISLGVISFASAGVGEGGALSLSEFQRLLTTGLDDELAKIADGSRGGGGQKNIRAKRRSNVRRRAVADGDGRDREDLAAPHRGAYPFPSERVWDDLVDHAWKTAHTIKRGENKGLSVTSDPHEAHPCPFLVCVRGRRDRNSDDDEGAVQDILTAFDKPYDDTLLISSSNNETCLILTTKAIKAQEAIDDFEGSQTLEAVPLIDVTKVHAGTIDEVSSPGWTVPFVENRDAEQSVNDTEAMNQWERMIVVEFVPGLGGMKEESELLEVVDEMMGDVQDMGEVGWLRSMDVRDAEEYYVSEALVGVPALSDMFSLTTSLRSIKNHGEDGNARVAFWRESLSKGIESEHACGEMFSTLFVKPRAGYYGYDLVLNPSDGPPPTERESSASNPACVASLIAALSTHPYVFSVRANFPSYHGWDIAQQLDSSRR